MSQNLLKVMQLELFERMEDMHKEHTITIVSSCATMHLLTATMNVLVTIGVYVSNPG